MRTVEGVVLGSTVVLFSLGEVQAADLPVNAKAVEYVRICSLYGAGFWYIPGTDTCIKIGGFLRIDTTFNASAAYGGPAYLGDIGFGDRFSDLMISRSRLALPSASSASAFVSAKIRLCEMFFVHGFSQ